MGKRQAVAIAALASAATLIFAPAALASTEVGSNCQGNAAEEGGTFLPLAHGSGSPLPVTTPVGGVVTQWKTNVVSEGAGISQTLKVFRSSGPENRFTLVAESAAATLSGGPNTFATRIPVQAGDRFGIAGTPVSLYCRTEDPNDSVGFTETASPLHLGSNEQFETAAEIQVPVAAIVEPDVDGDGFGDETQDKCPQSAALQTPCPVVTLSTSSAAGGGLVKVLVTSNVQASVTVAGSAKLGKGKPAMLSGGTQIVAPGVIAKFPVVLPAKVKSKLKQLSPKQRLTVNFSATAPNVVGAPTVSSLKVKLKGQAKPKPEAKPKPKS